MKIPNKITKAQFTALNKKNYTWLKGDINSQQSDLIIEAAMIATDDINHPSTTLAAERLSTINYWNKEVKKGFRDFAKCNLKILKARERGIAYEAKHGKIPKVVKYVPKVGDYVYFKNVATGESGRTHIKEILKRCVVLEGPGVISKTRIALKKADLQL